MKRLSIITFALLLVAAVASADHGGMGAPPPGMGPGDGFGGGPGGELIVGSDGTVYAAKTTGTSGSFTTTLTAISSTGTTRWTATLPSGGRGVRLSGTNLITSSDTKNSDGTFTSTVTAISTASGSAVWTKTFSGHADVAGSFNGETYVVVVVPATTSGGTANRSLVALDSNGSTLWTVSI